MSDTHGVRALAASSHCGGSLSVPMLPKTSTAAKAECAIAKTGGRDRRNQQRRGTDLDEADMTVDGPVVVREVQRPAPGG
jgi:hypothetical protein